MFKILGLTIGGLIACVILSSCDHNKQIKPNTKHEYVDLKVEFLPAFTEASEVWLSKSDSIKFIQILVHNVYPDDKKQDTFLFKKIYLTDQEYLKLDTSVIKLASKKMGYANDHLLDGMPVISTLINNGDTNIIYRNGPHEKYDPIGYHYVKTLMDTFKTTLQDSLIIEYFNDIEDYIDDSKFHRANPRRKIDQLRMKKYNWTINEQ